jgi:tRNA G18 (ribose-2'-O)-methylase SpoU
MTVVKANHFFDQEDFTGPVIIADRIQTPENIGSILRIAGNIGCKKVVLTEALEITKTKIEKIARNSMQYLETEILSFDEIAKRYQPLIAIETSDKACNIYETNLPREAAFIVGNEKYGISEELLKLCETHVYIPMPGQVKSLNVSHALSVGLFEWYRQNFMV